MHLTLLSPLIWIADPAIDFSRNKLKILAWHGNGFVLLLKRLEQGRFTVTPVAEGGVQLAEKPLSWLVGWTGLVIHVKLEHADLMPPPWV